MKAGRIMHAGTLIVLCAMWAASGVYAEGLFVPESSAKGLYGAVKAGPSYNSDLDSAWDDGSLTGQDTDAVSPAYTLAAGYLINPYVSAEASYRHLGEASMKAVSDGSGDSWAAGPVRGEQEAEGWALTVTGRWPISERWTLVGTFGWFWWESEERYVESGFSSSISESGSSAVFSGGVEFDHGLKDRIVYTAELGHQRVGDDDYDTVTGFAGVLYRFP